MYLYAHILPDGYLEGVPKTARDCVYPNDETHLTPSDSQAGLMDTQGLCCL